LVIGAISAESTRLPYIRQVFATRPPYALHTPPFRFPALAALAGRGQLGGDREVALAAFVTARLVTGVLPPNALSAPVRATRAAAARQWLAALTLPAAMRLALVRLADATAAADPVSVESALRAMLETINPALDTLARQELATLIRAVETAGQNGHNGHAEATPPTAPPARARRASPASRPRSESTRSESTRSESTRSASTRDEAKRGEGKRDDSARDAPARDGA
jgi:hypothetical protein